MKVTREDIKQMVMECLSRLNEEREDYYGDENWHSERQEYTDDAGITHFTDKKGRWREVPGHGDYNYGWDAFVIIDDWDGSIVATYDNNGKEYSELYDEACEEAQDMANKNRNTTFSVYGCLDDEYSEDTLLSTMSHE